MDALPSRRLGLRGWLGVSALLLVAAGVAGAAVFLHVWKERALGRARMLVDEAREQAQDDLSEEAKAREVLLYTRALPDLDRWDRDGETTWRAHFERASKSWHRLVASHADVIEDTTFVIEHRPDDAPTIARAYVMRGHARLALTLDGALRDLDEAVRLSDTIRKTWYPDPYALRATARALAGDFDGARTDLNEAARRLDGWQRSETRWQRGFIDAALGDSAETVKDFDSTKDDASSVWRALFTGNTQGLASRGPQVEPELSEKRYLEGTCSADDLLSAAEHPFEDSKDHESWRRYNLCQAHAVIAARSELEGDLVAAKSHYEACVAVGFREWQPEVYFAKGRLARLGTLKLAELPKTEAR